MDLRADHLVPTPRRRIVVAVVVGVVCAIHSVVLVRRWPLLVPDFDQLWLAARAWRSGGDPYAAVSAAFPYPLFYPFTTVVFVLPFSFLPLAAARCIFVGLGAGLLAYAVTGRGWWMLWLFLGNNVRNALHTAQWSTWLTAAALLPWLGLVFAAKPTIGLAIFGSRPSRIGLALAVALVVLSLLIWPAWPSTWWVAIHTTAESYRAPITRPWGWILLLALLRWRDPGGRLLAIIACVPQTTAIYETVELYLVCRTRAEVAILALLSYMVQFLAPEREYESLAIRLTAEWPLLFGLLYVPALLMVLRRSNSRNG
jgi:hypothetical protein